MTSWYSDSLRAGPSADLIPVGGTRFFRTTPNRPWGPRSLLYNGCRVIPRVKRPRCGVNHPPHLTSRLQEELGYIATPPQSLHGLFCGYLYLYFYYSNVMTSMQQFITRTIIILTTVTIKDWQKPVDKKKNTINEVAKRQVKYCSSVCTLLQL